jgi:hypothetical protein
MSLLFVLLLFTADCTLFVLWVLCVMDHSSTGSVTQIACNLLCEMQRSSPTLHTHWTGKKRCAIHPQLVHYIICMLQGIEHDLWSDLNELVGSRNKSSKLDDEPLVVLSHTICYPISFNIELVDSINLII